MALAKANDLNGFNAETYRSNSGAFKFNVSAPEFVPSVTASPTSIEVPVSGYFYPCFQYVDGNGGSWIYVADPEISIPLVKSKSLSKVDEAETPPPPQQQEQQPLVQEKEIAISDELKRKIIKQAEYMFSDISLLANETLMKHVNSDPEGYVPINFVSTLKKLKSLGVNNPIVAQALRSSTKLIVSIDGKKVRRKQSFTEKDKEEVQMRTVVAENLPDDHSHQKIQKMFNVVGSIKSIRICQPQEHNPSRSTKGNLVVSNKVHALVEYENSEAAEKAVAKLNDEKNWRKGMCVRLMLKHPQKSKPKTRKANSDVSLDDNGLVYQSHKDIIGLKTFETPGANKNSVAPYKSWSAGPTKPKQLAGTRGLPAPSPHSKSSVPGQTAKGPRMPDGTKGFTMGRGKPLSVPTQTS